MKKTTTILCVFSLMAFLLFSASAANAGSCCACAEAENNTSVTVEDNELPGLPDVKMGNGPRGVAGKPSVAAFSQTLVLGGMKISTLPAGQTVMFIGNSHYLFFLPDAIYMVRYLAPVTKRGRGTGIFAKQEDSEKVLRDGIDKTAKAFSWVGNMIVYTDPWFDPNVAKKYFGIPVSGGYQYGSAGGGIGKETAREEQVTNILGHAFEILKVGTCSAPVAAAPEPEPVVQKPAPKPAPKKPCNGCREIQERLIKKVIDW